MKNNPTIYWFVLFAVSFLISAGKLSAKVFSPCDTSSLEDKLVGKTWKLSEMYVDNISMDTSLCKIKYEFISDDSFILYSLPHRGVFLKWKIDASKSTFSIFRDTRLDHSGKIVALNSKNFIIIFKQFDNTLKKERTVKYVMVPE